MRRWRLVLGQSAESHGISCAGQAEAERIEQLVGFLFEPSEGQGQGQASGGRGSGRSSDRSAGLGPSQLTVPAGTTVIWVNDEQAKHTASADDGHFDSGDQELGVRYAYTFTEPGTYGYFCRYHGDVGGVGMAGTIVVE